MGNTSPGGDATDYQSNPLPNGWNRYNNQETTPLPGDIVVYGAGTTASFLDKETGKNYIYGSSGHIAIVVNATNSYYNIVEFNGSDFTSTYNYPLWDFTCVIRPDWPDGGSSTPSQPDPTPTKGTYGNLTYEIQFGRVGIIGCDKSATVVEIPSQIENLPVTYIGDLAFADCTSLTSITIPNSVTKIGGWAFSNCTGLTSVTIPNSVTSLGGFSGCTGLRSIAIPNSVTSIDLDAFSDCTGLTSVTIPNSVTSIGNSAFQRCTGLTNVTIPSSVTSIGDSAFSGCPSLTSITIPDSVTSIGGSAFAYCAGLTSIAIPNSVTSIGSSAFYKCTGLTSVTIPNSITSIGLDAFCECTGLTSITIPNSVTSIGDYAFAWCTGLTSIVIPNSITSIGDSAFYKCTGLTDVYYSGSESQWKAISVGISNSPLRNAIIHYYSIGTISFKDIVQQLVGGTKNFLGFIAIRCPVDVEIYIGDQLVGWVVNNTVNDVVSEKVYIGVEDDAKYVYFLTSEEYTIKLTATGTGTMEYTAQNLDVPSWTKLDGKYFRQVSLTPDKKMVSYINYLDNDLVDTPNVQLYVLDDAGETEKVVLPDDKGTEVPVNTPVVTFDTTVASISVPPMAVGEDGTLIQLPAPTRSGYTFNGWYLPDGTKVTTDTVFADSVTVTAKWTQNNPGGSTPSGNTPSNPGSSSYNPGSYTAPTYSIAAPFVTGGKVSVSPSSASSGSTVTVTATPDSGYKLVTLTVSDANGKTLELTDKGDGKYSFKMPNGKVTLNAEFQRINSEAPWSNPFTDVSVDVWYYDAVKYVNENGLMDGIGNSLFAPNANLSRAMLAQILYNKEGRPVVSGGTSAFPDVSLDDWYANAVSWAYAQGIIKGYDNGLFGPGDDITREQLAVMLWRYAGEPVPPNLLLNFTDAYKVSSYAQDALRWAVDKGIINGKGNGILDPTGKATRAEAAQMFKNYLTSS